MASWNPQNKVGPNEHIGRRLFDEPMLAGVTGQPSYSGIALYHFEETRYPEVSLDRLGASGIARNVTRYLLPRAEAAGRTFSKPKQFDGWAVVPAKELTNARKVPKLQVFASPVKDPKPSDNKYHAHVLRPDSLTVHLMALHLRHIFTTYGKIEQSKTLGSGWVDSFWQHPVIRWIVARFSR